MCKKKKRKKKKKSWTRYKERTDKKEKTKHKQNREDLARESCGILEVWNVVERKKNDSWWEHCGVVGCCLKGGQKCKSMTETTFFLNQLNFFNALERKLFFESIFWVYRENTWISSSIFFPSYLIKPTSKKISFLFSL